MDQCGWEYDSWNDPGNAKQAYVEKARKLLTKFSVKQVQDFIELM